MECLKILIALTGQRLKELEVKMTLEALENGIARLIIKRRAANSEEQIEINQKLSKLYDLKFLMLEQSENNENLYCKSTTM